MISVIIPTLNEAKAIAEVVSFCLRNPLVTEVIVIDDGSVDDTPLIAKAAGAKVYLSSMQGKGASMHDGLLKTSEDIILFLDGDIYNFSPNLIELMTEPFFENNCDFVKGKFQRKGGRVTILTAKPMLNAFFPELAQFEQPLGGVVAAKKDLLMKLEFESDYGVDIGLLIDAYKLKANIVEVSIGYLDHDQQTLESLSKMSNQVVRTILDRATKYKNLDSLHLLDSYELQRLGEYDLQVVYGAIGNNKKLALLDMDGTVIQGRFVEELAKESSKSQELKNFLDNNLLSELKRTREIARLFKGVNKETFEKVAKKIPLFPEVQEIIVELKKKDYIVGLITDSYFIASDIVRKRVFANFSVAHLLNFKKGFCTGEISISPFMLREGDGCHIHHICKSNFLRNIKDFLNFKIENVRYIGDGPNDICILKDTENSISINPKSIEVAKASKYQINNFGDVIKIWK